MKGGSGGGLGAQLLPLHCDYHFPTLTVAPTLDSTRSRVTGGNCVDFGPVHIQVGAASSVRM